MLKPAAHHRNGDEQNRRDNEGVQGEETHGLRFYQRPIPMDRYL